MHILFYDTKSYDQDSFETALENYMPLKNALDKIRIEYIKSDLDPRTAALAEGFDAVCAFVSSDVGTQTVQILHDANIKLILMRCAGFNNVDLDMAEELGIRVMRVPGYSPEAVAEHAMALALAANRRLHKAYNKVRENDFSLNGLMGFNFYQKTAGIIGTGKIGAAMCRICHGFGMRVIAYDVCENKSLREIVRYESLDTVLSESDLLSLHCPLTEETYHLIRLDTIRRMKDGVVLVNTSRGALVNTGDLIEGIRMRKFAGVGLDVYEEETDNVFEDRSDEILEHSTTARLLSFPHVMITSHQGFFTREALTAIAETTLQNALDFMAGRNSPNDVIYS
ncbi:MAG: 2-hydroxyacid dehydrogenase [Acetatifactor muris]|nr:2-hydroxyacid dehydrogenase [Acetatifactor muris]MCM1526602.1 2-hydroxyacid dehydrogenase [Bacteroides sp.]